MKQFLVYFASSFILHLIWENAQMPLFESGDASLWDNFKMCLWATATDDMFFMLTLYLTVALIHKNIWWICDRSTFIQPATWIVPVMIGVLLAVSFELWAVHATGRWIYSSMPMIPVIKVGLTPVLQMTLIPLAAIASGMWSLSRS
ncbi:hypothetical protein [Novipirellula rosea]|uniref:Uncharacterized protein n=1 Tax=Novipirellula rosea TaxID=1031540 RepID=A0ABP8NND8_9BACT